jgi:hypothetical protein
MIVQVPGPQGVKGNDGDAGTGGITGWFKKPNLSEATAIPAAITNEFLIMLGQAEAGDGYGGIFWYNPLSVALDNYDHTNATLGGSVINPFGNSSAGRWLRYL